MAHDYAEVNMFWTILWGSINTVLLLITIVVVFKIIKNQFNLLTKTKSSKCMSITALFVVINSIISLTLSVLICFSMVFEIRWLASTTLTPIFAVLYASGNYFLTLTFFTRLYFSFNQSVLALSNCVTRIYIMVFILLPILSLPWCATYHIRGSLLWIAAISMFIILIVSTQISLMLLFVFKLVKTSKLNTKNDVLLSLTKKITILAIISLSSNILAPIGVIARYRYQHNTEQTIGYLHFITNCFVSFDIYTNFLCVILSWSFCDYYYQKLCGCFEVTCCYQATDSSTHSKDIASTVEIVTTNSTDTISTMDIITTNSRGTNPTVDIITTVQKPSNDLMICVEKVLNC